MIWYGWSFWSFGYIDLDTFAFLRHSFDIFKYCFIFVYGKSIHTCTQWWKITKNVSFERFHGPLTLSEAVEKSSSLFRLSFFTQKSSWTVLALKSKMRPSHWISNTVLLWSNIAIWRLRLELWQLYFPFVCWFSIRNQLIFYCSQIRWPSGKMPLVQILENDH